MAAERLFERDTDNPLDEHMVLMQWACRAMGVVMRMRVDAAHGDGGGAMVTLLERTEEALRAVDDVCSAMDAAKVSPFDACDTWDFFPRFFFSCACVCDRGRSSYLSLSCQASSRFVGGVTQRREVFVLVARRFHVATSLLRVPIITPGGWPLSTVDLAVTGTFLLCASSFLIYTSASHDLCPCLCSGNTRATSV